MKRALLIAAIVVSQISFGQTRKTILLPADNSKIQHNQWVSTYVWKQIKDGKLNVYSTDACAKLMDKKQIMAIVTDSTLLTMTDVNGEVTGKRVVAMEYQPDTLLKLEVVPKGTDFRKAVLVFKRSLKGGDGVFLGMATMCYVRYTDLEKVVKEFEQVNYPTGLGDQTSAAVK